MHITASMYHINYKIDYVCGLRISQNQILLVVPNTYRTGQAMVCCYAARLTSIGETEKIIIVVSFHCIFPSSSRWEMYVVHKLLSSNSTISLQNVFRYINRFFLQCRLAIRANEIEPALPKPQRKFADKLGRLLDPLQEIEPVGEIRPPSPFCRRWL